MRLFNIFLFCLFINLKIISETIDLTLMGYNRPGDGLGRIPSGLVYILKDHLKINFIRTRKTNDKNFYLVDFDFKTDDGLKNPGKVVILTDAIYYKNFDVVKVLPKESKIKVAYSMFETSKISKDWVNILNNHFDLVVVPDPYLIDVYISSGVNIPVFFIPLGIFLEDFLKHPVKTKPNKVFTFGCTSSFDKRKNQGLLIQAFYEEFGNDPNYLLKLNGRFGEYKRYVNFIRKNNIKNIQITNEDLSWESYLEFILSLDCYVNISKGEGFSIPPREALALGIPCILSNNTAQMTLCKINSVIPIKCDILEPAYYNDLFGNEQLGYFYNCKKNKVKKALKSMAQNYDKFVKHAQFNRTFANSYNWKNLTLKYLNLVNPKKIVFADKNEITNEYFMTNSWPLYQKYKRTFNV